MNAYKELVNDFESFLGGVLISEKDKEIITHMKNADISKYNVDKKISANTPEFKMDDKLKAMLNDGGCKSFSNFDEIYSILSPIAFDVDLPTKESDIARIGIYRIFASKNTTDAILKDMVERFLSDNGTTEKCDKLYYELLVNSPLSQNDFNRIYNNFDLSLMHYVHISMNPFNKTEAKNIFIDTWVSKIINESLLRDSNWKNAMIMAQQGSYSTMLQKKIIDEHNKKRPLSGIKTIIHAMIESNNISNEAFEYAIHKSKTPMEKLEFMIYKAIQNLGYEKYRPHIIVGIQKGYDKSLDSCLQKINSGLFFCENEINDVLKFIETNNNLDGEIRKIISSTKENMQIMNDNVEMYCEDAANNTIITIMNELSKYKIAPNQYVVVALKNLDDYIKAKQYLKTTEKEHEKHFIKNNEENVEKCRKL